MNTVGRMGSDVCLSLLRFGREGGILKSCLRNRRRQPVIARGGGGKTRGQRFQI
jgi:hypothetical protein